MQKETISKIKDVDCRIGHQEDENSKQEIFCYGNNGCDNCCGLEDCECDNYLKIKKSE